MAFEKHKLATNNVQRDTVSWQFFGTVDCGLWVQCIYRESSLHSLGVSQSETLCSSLQS